jgi:hypothetical protein
MKYVLDSSAAVKWESDSDKAIRLREDYRETAGATSMHFAA